jgi:hypothetical protein
MEMGQQTKEGMNAIGSKLRVANAHEDEKLAPNPQACI